MNSKECKKILKKAKIFFEEFAKTHFKNTIKAGSLKNYNVNPFLTNYLANFLTGNDKPDSIAKALIYPRVLGTSVTTSFGNYMQTFCSEVLEGFASVIPGLDIEFIDQIDGRKKYCQLKSGPNTINKDDVKTIIDHFKGTRQLARTNKLRIDIDDMIVGVLYGEPNELSGHYKKIKKDFPVFIGQEFWHRLTGHENFYSELIEVFGKVAIECDGTEILALTIKKLSKEVEGKSKQPQS